nr:putative mfs-type transporter [Quercus suber]
MAEFAAAVAKAPAHGPDHTMDSDRFAPGLYHTDTNTQDFAGHDEQTGTTSQRKSTGWRGLLGRKNEPEITSKNADTSISEKYLAGSHSGSTSDDEERRLEHVPTGQSLKHMETTQTTFDQAMDGSLYRDGALIMQPAPSQDPRDPLNLSMTRKIVAVFCLCFFGALAASAELILGAMLPVFALEYAGIPTHLLIDITKGGLPAGGDPLKTLEDLPNAKPIWEIYLLASLPVLMIGLSNLILIPGAITFGRRPIILLCGVLAIGGAIWAGFSQSLASHIGARCVQALGAGTVESLIPFIIQDIVFVHQRNTWISGVFAAQGVIIIALGISAPYIIIRQTWRDVYFITAGDGIPRIESHHEAHAPRTFVYDISIFHGKTEWRKGWMALVDTLRTFFYPQIFFITMLNSAMIACAFGAGYTVSPALLTQPWSWPFLHVGLCLIPILLAGIAAGLITGPLADWTSNIVARKRGKRSPENQLLNLILPTVCALVGSVIFALSGDNQEDYSWAVFLLALGLMAFGFLGANTVGAVYVLECYPHLAGPALVNIASFRCIIAFVLSFKVSEWVADLGYFDSFIIYTALMGFFALLIPIVYVYGPAWRKRWPADRMGEQSRLRLQGQERGRTKLFESLRRLHLQCLYRVRPGLEEQMLKSGALRAVLRCFLWTGMLTPGLQPGAHSDFLLLM